MRPGALYLAIAVVLSLFVPAWGQSDRPQTNPPSSKVPEHTILVKGAWSSATDTVTPVPEGSRFDKGVFENAYFGVKYSLPAGWEKSYDGPPPSDSGRYVVAQIRIRDPKEPASRGSLLITADDLFFTALPAANALEFIRYMRDHLQTGYEQEEPPAPTEIAGHPFLSFGYWSPVAQLHWYVAATKIRCHTVGIILSSRDTRLLANGVVDLNKMTLPAEAGPTGGTGGGSFPVCIKDYAQTENLLVRVEPSFPQPRGNSVPVRIIIGKDGKVTHIHFVSAFAEQAKAITDALFQWRFKPYLENGHPVEVETGILFGRPPLRPATTPHVASATPQ